MTARWTPRTGARALVLVLATGMLLGVGACSKSSNHATNNIQPAADHFRLSNITGVTPSLQFNMTDSNGKKVTAVNYRGKYVLLYFGYTHCPDVCPTTVARMAQALQELGHLANRVQVLFVSVDPTRDTTKVLREYTHNFGPHIVGLRGTSAQTQIMANRYHVTYGLGKRDKDGNYVVAHSSAIYIFDPNGKARLLARATDPAASISHDLRMLMGGA
jgi:protein SCO1/2